MQKLKDEEEYASAMEIIDKIWREVVEKNRVNVETVRAASVITSQLAAMKWLTPEFRIPSKQDMKVVFLISASNLRQLEPVIVTILIHLIKNTTRETFLTWAEELKNDWCKNCTVECTGCIIHDKNLGEHFSNIILKDFPEVSFLTHQNFN